MPSTSNSKRDYLSKYYDDPKSKKTKKGKKKSKKKEGYGLVLEEPANVTVGVAFTSPDDVEDEDEDDLSKDADGPVIVKEYLEDPVVSSAHISKGIWTVQNTAEETNGEGKAFRQRRRYDSDEELESKNLQQSSAVQNRNKPPKRRRHDSDDDDDDDRSNGEQRRTPIHLAKVKGESEFSTVHQQDRIVKEEGSAAGLRRRQRYDSSEEEQEEAYLRKRKGLDSDEQSAMLITKGRQNRKRYDTDESVKELNDRPRRHESDTESDDNCRHRSTRRGSLNDSSSDHSGRRDQSDRRTKMQSGHDAGLQSGSKFSLAERKIQEKRFEQVQDMVNKHGMGDTVHRDEFGRKVVEPVKDITSGKQHRQLSQQEQLELNLGRVQKEQQVAEQMYMKYLQQSTFARHTDDERLEAMRKNVIREGDPMAKQKSNTYKHDSANHTSSRRVYQGPPAKPNRFGILPGYRWDGVDRGNGFEDKLLARKYSEQYKREQAYKYSSADM